MKVPQKIKSVLILFFLIIGIYGLNKKYIDASPFDLETINECVINSTHYSNLKDTTLFQKEKNIEKKFINESIDSFMNNHNELIGVYKKENIYIYRSKEYGFINFEKYYELYIIPNQRDSMIVLSKLNNYTFLHKKLNEFTYVLKIKSGVAYN